MAKPDSWENWNIVISDTRTGETWVVAFDAEAMQSHIDPPEEAHVCPGWCPDCLQCWNPDQRLIAFGMHRQDKTTIPDTCGTSYDRLHGLYDGLDRATY